jgi:hypothetical protein
MLRMEERELIAEAIFPGQDFVHPSKPLMEARGFEPLTSSLQSWRSTN